MKAYLDTIIIVDVLKESRDNHVDSATILKLARQDYIEAVISTQTVLDTYYVISVSEKYPLEKFKVFLKALFSAVLVTSIDAGDLLTAINSSNRDFEDASQISCALTAGCDCIISSDKKMKQESPIPVYTPMEFCNLVFTPWH